MAELVEIRRVEIGPENLTAFVRLAEGAPLMTSDDLEGTARVYRLLPHIVEHACIGDAGETFRDAMGATELAHLLEHVTVELLAQTDLAGDIPCGRTWVDEVDDRTYKIELACPDDVLVAAALSCGVWILDWAYTGGADPEPDVEAIVAGLVNLVDSVDGEGEDMVVDYGPAEDEPESEEEASEEDEAPAEAPVPVAEPAPAEPEDAPATVPAADPEPAPVEPAKPARSTLWTAAPEVPTSARRARHERAPRIPEVEAEIDQIMSTIEMPALDVDSYRSAYEDALSQVSAEEGEQ